MCRQYIKLQSFQRGYCHNENKNKTKQDIHLNFRLRRGTVCVICNKYIAISCTALLRTCIANIGAICISTSCTASLQISQMIEIGGLFPMEYVV